MIRVYCDTGGYLAALREMEICGSISLCTYAYKNTNRKIKSRAPSSNPTWEEGDSTWEDEGGTWLDYSAQSPKWQEILALVGKNNVQDAKHLDSAYQAGCHAFLTSDKDDLASRREEIYALLGIRIFHVQSDWAAFTSFANCGA